VTRSLATFIAATFLHSATLILLN